MSYIQRIRNIFLPEGPSEIRAEILPLEDQADVWRKASGKMRWGIREEEFERLIPPPPLTADERVAGFSGTVLFYGFGDDGEGNADAVLSGKEARSGRAPLSILKSRTPSGCGLRLR